MMFVMIFHTLVGTILKFMNTCENVKNSFHPSQRNVVKLNNFLPCKRKITFQELSKMIVSLLPLEHCHYGFAFEISKSKISLD